MGQCVSPCFNIRPCRTETRGIDTIRIRALTGAGVRLPAAVAEGVEVGDAGELCFDVGPSRLSFEAAVRSRRMRPDQTLTLGLEFAPGQDHERARLALALFHSGAALEIVPQAAAA